MPYTGSAGGLAGGLASAPSIVYRKGHSVTFCSPLRAEGPQCESLGCSEAQAQVATPSDLILRPERPALVRYPVAPLQGARGGAGRVTWSGARAARFSPRRHIAGSQPGFSPAPPSITSNSFRLRSSARTSRPRLSLNRTTRLWYIPNRAESH
jgi:hypothetical protein